MNTISQLGYYKVCCLCRIFHLVLFLNTGDDGSSNLSILVMRDLYEDDDQSQVKYANIIVALTQRIKNLYKTFFNSPQSVFCNYLGKIGEDKIDHGMKIRKVFENEVCLVGLKSFKLVKFMSAMNKFLSVFFRSQCYFQVISFCGREKYQLFIHHQQGISVRLFFSPSM